MAIKVDGGYLTMVTLMSEQFNKHLFHQQCKYKQLLLVIFNLAPKQFTN